MNKLTLKAEKRTQLGRKVKVLRREGILPANVYGKKVKSLSIQIKSDEFEKVYKQAGETSLVELVVGGKKRPVLVHDIQTDPVSDQIIHADFLQVNLKEKVTANVKVDVIGESPAAKQGLGILVQQLEEVEVEALPMDLPEKFEISIEGLEEVDSAVTVSDLKVDKKVEIKTDREQIIAKVEPLSEEEEEPVPVVEGEEDEESGAEEGEETKEGETVEGAADEDKTKKVEGSETEKAEG